MPQPPVFPDRRTTLAALAGFLAAPARPFASEVEPDAELLALAGRFSAAWRTLREASANADAIEKVARASLPGPPDTMRRTGDFRLFWGAATNPDSPEFYTAAECVAFRTYVPLGRGFGQEHKEACRRRAAEIIAAYEQWVAEIRQHDERCGLVDADAVSDAAYEAASVLATALSEIPATTLAGISAKARVAQAMEWDGQIEQVLAELIAMGGEA